MGQHCPARSPAIAKSRVQSQTANHFNDSLNLMHTLMEYRQQPIHSKLLKNPRQIFHVASGRPYSDLPTTLRTICSGNILEIGAFVGGATITAAFGVRDSGTRKKIITIEPGGSVKHKRLGTRNIFRDLERNLARQRVSELVTTYQGPFF